MKSKWSSEQRASAHEATRDVVMGIALIVGVCFFVVSLTPVLVGPIEWLLIAVVMFALGYAVLSMIRLGFDYMSSRGNPRSRKPIVAYRDSDFRIDESELRKRRYAELMAWNEELADWSRRLKQRTGLSYEEWLTEERWRTRFRWETEHYRRVAKSGQKSIDRP